MQDGWTALMWAATSGRCGVVTELISLGADVDFQTNVSHFLCLIMTLPNGLGSLECTVCCIIKSIFIHLNPGSAVYCYHIHTYCILTYGTYSYL